jgi:CubicO group peptidase (beta-lactamase class C family)
MKGIKETTRILFLFLFILLFVVSGAWAQDVNIVDPESVGMSSAMLENIDTVVQKGLSGKFFKGAVVLVARHGKICYFKPFGDADEGKPMETNAIFRLASMTKTITAAALMQLWDKGFFQLKDPVSRYIPEFKDMKVAEMGKDGKIKLVPAKREIRIQDLLSFTSGISTTLFMRKSPVHAYVGKCYAKEGVQDLLSETYTKNLAENVKALAKCPLVFQPGEGWCYNQGGTDVVACLVEIISGKPFDQYLEENLFSPLKMKDFWFYPPEDAFSRIPPVYLKPGTLVKATKEWPFGPGVMGPLYTFGKNKAYFAAGGGLHGTTYGFYRFAQMLLNGGQLDGVRVLSSQAVKLMTTIQVGDGPKFRNFITHNQWGYCVDIQPEEKMNALNDWYGGKGCYSWRGFWSTLWINDPADDTVVMFMAQIPRAGFPWGLKVKIAASAAVIE